MKFNIENRGRRKILFSKNIFPKSFFGLAIKDLKKKIIFSTNLKIFQILLLLKNLKKNFSERIYRWPLVKICLFSIGLLRKIWVQISLGILNYSVLKFIRGKWNHAMTVMAHIVLTRVITYSRTPFFFCDSSI